MKVMIELTWSKFMALVVLVYAFIQDLGPDGHEALIYSLPFVVFLITGKQVIDWRRGNEEIKDNKI